MVFFGLGRVNPELISLMHIDILVVIEMYRLLTRAGYDSSCYDYVVTPVNSAS